MKVSILSDLHLEHFSSLQVFNPGEGDILILAGDILCVKHFKKNGYLHAIYDRFLNDCSQNYNHILYVMGNHESYGYHYQKTKNKLKKYLPYNFHLLDNDTVTINKWNFIGFTLWTDFRNENPLEMMDAQSTMNDYKVIRCDSNFRKLTVNDTLEFHKKSKEYLLNQLNIFKENVFVISHHTPSYQSIPDEYKNSANGAYSNNLDDLIITNSQIKYFVHGHTHNFFDYMIEQCRVICNPVGYPGQSTGYDSKLVLELT